MPLIRYTYSRDIAREGSGSVEVTDERARLLLNQRRAVIVQPEPAKQPVKRAVKRRKAK